MWLFHATLPATLSAPHDPSHPPLARSFHVAKFPHGGLQMKRDSHVAGQNAHDAGGHLRLAWPFPLALHWLPLFHCAGALTPIGSVGYELFCRASKISLASVRSGSTLGLSSPPRNQRRYGASRNPFGSHHGRHMVVNVPREGQRGGMDGSPRGGK